MRRPMTSAVSALSGFGANGHQAIHHVSSSPSEIPYGGFSPVRLQIGLRPRPSPLPAYTRPESARRTFHGSPSRGNNRHQGGLGKPAPQTVRSRGPWLGVGLCCPVASKLTMASSEALALSRRLMYSPASLCLAAEDQRFPNLSCMSFLPCRFPYPGGSGGLSCSRLTRIVFARFGGARHPRFPPQSVRVGT
jgi:hypothetical protein